MTIWIFGDSFAHNWNHKDQWMNQLSNKMNGDVKCFGLAGSSLDYTYTKFNEVRNDISVLDTVIILLTNIERRWLFEDRPNDCCFTDPEDIGERRALKYYQLYLNHEEIFEVYLYNFLHNLHYLTKKLNLYTLIISNFFQEDNWLISKRKEFPHLCFANGILYDISLGEIKKNSNVPVDKLLTNDFRFNHLIKSNHDILAEKIAENVDKKDTISLDNFITDIIDEKILLDEEFRKTELFDNESKLISYVLSA